jgi:hypothetical protein
VKTGFVFILFFLTICSCQSKFDGSIIIGSKSRTLPYDKGLPYGQGFIVDGYKNVNGIRHRAIAIYYNNNAIVYLVNENWVITDYFFSKLIRYKQAYKIPLNTDHEIVKRKFGEPAFHSFKSDKIDDISKGSQLDSFTYTYLQRKKESLFGPYDLSPVIVELTFDYLGKLRHILVSRITR